MKSIRFLCILTALFSYNFIKIQAEINQTSEENLQTQSPLQTTDETVQTQKAPENQIITNKNSQSQGTFQYLLSFILFRSSHNKEHALQQENVITIDDLINDLRKKLNETSSYTYQDIQTIDKEINTLKNTIDKEITEDKKNAEKVKQNTISLYQNKKNNIENESQKNINELYKKYTEESKKKDVDSEQKKEYDLDFENQTNTIKNKRDQILNDLKLEYNNDLNEAEKNLAAIKAKSNQYNSDHDSLITKFKETIMQVTIEYQQKYFECLEKKETDHDINFFSDDQYTSRDEKHNSDSYQYQATSDYINCHNCLTKEDLLISEFIKNSNASVESKELMSFLTRQMQKVSENVPNKIGYYNCKKSGKDIRCKRIYKIEENNQ